MYAIFQIDGGIGKCISATAVVRAIKKTYPESKIIVVSGYPEVFVNNPNVFKTVTHGQTQYFYQDYIEGKTDSKVFVLNPYFHESFIHQNKHLVEVWCNMFGISDDGEEPEIFLTEREKAFYLNTIGHSEKPIMLIQTNGGAENQTIKYSWARDIPTGVVNAVVNHFKDDYNIVHLRRGDQHEYANTTTFNAPFRQVVALMSISKKRLFMDSFAQHLAAAMKLQSTVCWIANKPEVFGYQMHYNIYANPFTTKPEIVNSYLSKFDITGNPLEFPYNDESEIFDTDNIIKSIELQ